MELDLDSGRLLVFLGGFAVYFLVETVFPARPWEGSRWQRLGLPQAREQAFSVRAWVEEPFRGRNLDLAGGSPDIERPTY